MGKKCPELNSGSMSDISFLLLTFFLLVSSINTDMGIPRRLPPPLQPDMVAPEVHKRNIFVVKINSQNNLLFDGQIGDLKALRARAKEFLSNPQNLSNFQKRKLWIYLYWEQWKFLRALFRSKTIEVLHTTCTYRFKMN